MSETRIPARAGAHAGELRLTRSGLTFVPVTSLAGEQLCLDLTGWHLDWHDVNGFERVASRRGEVRVHHDECMRYTTVTIDGSMQAFFDKADACIAAAAQPAREAA